MKTIRMLICITFLVGVLVTQALSQDANQGALLFNQSTGLLKNAKSKEDLKRAADGFQKAYDIFLRTGNLNEAAIAANQTGFTKDRLGDLKGALEYYDKAYKIKVSSGDVEAQWTPLYNMANVHQKLGQYDDSEKLLHKVLDLCNRRDNPACLRAALNSLGIISNMKGNNEKALDYYNQSMDIAQRHNMKTEQAVVLNNMGNVYFSLGDYRRSYDTHKRALTIVRETRNPSSIAQYSTNSRETRWAWVYSRMPLSPLKKR